MNWKIEYAVFAAVSLSAILFLLWKFWKIQRARRILVMAAALLLIVLGSGAVWVKHAVNDERSRLQSMVQGIAPTYATEFEHHQHWQITTSTDANDPRYLEMIQMQKRWLEANPAVADVYTFRKNAAGKLLLIVDSETDYDRNGQYDGEREARTPIGEEYDGDDPIFAAFNGQTGFQDIPDTDEWGTWVSAAAPIRSPDGTVEAIVGVDYPAQEWTAALTQSSRSAGGQIAVLVMFMLGACAIICILNRGLEENLRHAEQLQQNGVALARAREAADRANRAKSAFLAGLSQQIRGPLSAILGYAELLKDESCGATDREKHAMALHRNAGHLTALVSDLQDLVRIETGQLRINAADFDLPQFIEEIAESSATRLQTARQILRVEYRGAIPRTLRNDAARIRQILATMIAKASEKSSDGTLTLALNCQPDGAGSRLKIELAFVQESQAAELCAITMNESMEMSLATQLSGLLGGSFSLMPGEHGRESFCLELPAPLLSTGTSVSSRPLLARTAAPSPAPQRSLAGLRLLAAVKPGDEEVLLRAALSSAKAEFVANPRDVLGRALMTNVGGQPYDVIILATQLPGGSGLELCSTLREKGYLHPVLAISDDPVGTNAERCMAHGFTEYLSIPFNREELSEKLLRLARRRHAA